MADPVKIKSVTRNVEREGANGVKFNVALVETETGEVVVDERILAAVDDPDTYLRDAVDLLFSGAGRTTDWSAVDA